MKNWIIRMPPIPPWVRLIIWGALASTLTVCIGYNLRFVSFLWWLVETGEIGTVGIILLLHVAAAVFAVWLWVEFYRAWKTRVSQ
jgi:hypothetical protein